MDWKRLFPFAKGPKDLLGIDVGVSAIKVVELDRAEGRYALKNYAIFPLTSYLMQSGHEATSEPLKVSGQQIAKAIRKSLNEAGIDAKTAFLSLPINLSFSTLITFPPNIPDKEIAAAAPLEARKYIPVPLSEVVLDWNIFNTLSKKGGKQAFVVAVPKEIVAKCGEIMKLAGLNLSSIEGEIFCLHRSLIGNDKSTIMLVDAGSRSTSLSIIDAGNVRVVHSLRLGGMEISRRIAQAMNVGFDEAEALKRKLGQAGNEHEQAKNLIRAMLNNLFLEIKKVVQAYENKYGRKVEKCILTGGGTKLYGFAEQFKSKLGLDVSPGRPFARVVLPSSLPQPVFQELDPMLAIAVGLAMK